MKKVDVSSLVPGSVAEHDYYSERGDLLLSRGVAITPRHLEMLRRRNVYEVYVKLSGEDEELEQLLSAEIKSLGDLDLDGPAPSRPPPPRKQPASRWHRAQALSRPEFKKISAGRDGFAQLLQSEVSRSLDTAFSGRTPDRPFAPALAARAKQIAVADRTRQYKRDIHGAYKRGLDETRRVLNELADGHRVSGADIRDIVKQFVRIFVTDRNILLNISAKKHDGDNYLYHHSLNVCLLAINIAASEGYNEAQVLEIGTGALLHDIGMLLIPPEIFAKRARLTQEEWYEVQKHPILALHLLERIGNMPDSVPYVAYQTHERENRAGYPKRRGAHLIHRFAKIVQVADVYEAMSSPRSYRKPLTPYRSMENVIKMSRKGLMAADFVEAFLRYASLFPVGSLVELDDKRIGRIIDANPINFARPTLTILTDAQGAILEKSAMCQLNLAVHPEVKIAQPLASDHLPHLDLMDGF